MKKPGYIEKTHFEGGFNDSLDPLEVEASQLSAVNNMVPYGGYIRKRRGFQKYPGTQALSNAICCLGEFRPANSAIRQICISGGTGYQIKNDAWVPITNATGLHQSAMWETINAAIGPYSALILTNNQNVPKKITFGGETPYDACEVLTGWNYSAPTLAPVLNAGQVIEGNYSIDLISGVNKVMDACDDLAAPWAATSPASAPTVNNGNYKEGVGSLNIFGSPNTTMNSCDSTSGWGGTDGNAVGLTADLNNVTFKEGTGSVGITLKAGAAGSYGAWQCACGVNLQDSNSYVQQWLYIRDSTTLAKLPATGTAITLMVHTNNGGYAGWYQKNYTRSQLATGWNLLGGVLTGWTFYGVGGTPPNQVTDYIKIFIYNGTHAVSTGELLVDYWYFYRSGHTLTYSKTVAAVDGTANPNGYVWFFVYDKTKLATTGAVKICFGSSSSAYKYKTYNVSALQDVKNDAKDGWNLLGGAFSGYTGTVGSPTMTALTYLRIDVVQADGLPNIYEGECAMDCWQVSGSLGIAYYKTISPVVDGTHYLLAQMWFYIDDITRLDSTTPVKIIFAKTSEYPTKYYYKTYARTDIANGWNLLGGALASAFTAVSAPSTTLLDYIRIEVVQDAGQPNLTQGMCAMDYWYGTTAEMAMADLGGTPMRCKYLVQFHNYTLGYNLTDRTDDSKRYPSQCQASDVGDPETWQATSIYVFGDNADGYEITGVAVLGNAAVVFKEKGIYEHIFTGDLDVPFTIVQTHEDSGAFFGSVQAVEGGIIFANYGGVWLYEPGGHIRNLGEDPRSRRDRIKNTWRTNVLDSSNLNALSSVFSPSQRRYYLCCGTVAGYLNEILFLDTGAWGWWRFSALATNFSITRMQNVTYSNRNYLWVGLSNGVTLMYDDDLPCYCDAGPLDIEASFDTHWFHENAPSMVKSLVEVVVNGHGDSDSAITASTLTDGQAAKAVGSFTLYRADKYDISKTIRLGGGSAYGKLHKMRFEEVGGIAGITDWEVHSLGIRQIMKGFGGYY
jgi:hypothetical protein